MKIGELLVKSKYITQVQLDTALQLQGRINDKRIGEILVTLKAISEADLMKCLSSLSNTNRFSSCGKANILVIDDDKSSCDLVKHFINKIGHSCVIANDGFAALGEISKNEPDMILLDIQMPKMDGREVLRIIKNDKLLRHIPVVMISVIDDIDTVVCCIKNGADDYLPKPFSISLLKARIDACLEKKCWIDNERQLYKELIKSYDALKKAENTRDTFFHMVVHDLKNPLANILSATELIDSTIESIDKEFLQKLSLNMSKSIKYVLTFVDSILDISKLESNTMPVLLKDINISEFSTELCEQFKLHANSLGKDFMFNRAREAVTVVADEKLLLRVLQNLFSNALKFSPEKSSIILSVTACAKNIIFKVANEGPLIPDEYKTRIFEKYFQTDQNKLACKGTGLGLTFCKIAVELMGGKIWVEKEQDTRNCFKVLLKKDRKCVNIANA